MRPGPRIPVMLCVALLALAPVTCPPPEAHGLALTRVVQVPRLEAEKAITDWLARSGHEVVRTERGQSVELVATRKGTARRIVLVHHSPLATEVAAPEGGPWAQDLWSFLDAYEETVGGTREYQANTIPEEVRRRSASTVCILAKVRGGPIQLSGFVVDDGGLVLCTAHLLRNPEEITITTASGGRARGVLVKVDYERDLALIDCPGKPGPAVELGGRRGAVLEGEQVYSVGCPGLNGLTINAGTVSGPPRLVNGRVFVQVRMPVSPGSSGSPVFDAAGALVGVVQGRVKPERRMGLVIPMDTVIEFVKER